MAVVEQSAGGHPKFSTKFFSQLFSDSSPSPISLKTPSLHRGKLAVCLTHEDVSNWSASFKLALIGKFSHRCLKIDEVCKFFVSVDLQNVVHVGYLDSHHVLLCFVFEVDFHRIWTRGFWHLDKYPMHVF